MKSVMYGVNEALDVCYSAFGEAWLGILEREICSCTFSFADLTSAELRLALVLFEGEKDVVVAFVSSGVP